ncbi:3-phosphoshikimate 1-carboxyvinyltransferase [Nonomuraea sp. NPDC050783]|uniref:3-phosphoshikimate 1-carboxyvinyltransferase n=1 Tax=Nonomuraea sp. NPDC050783 TaxID=3154634 RepID=UPI0034668C31
MIRVSPAARGVSGTARVPRSKPHMQRAILLSLLTNAPSIIQNPAWSSEARHLFEAARQWGLEVARDDGDRLVLTGAGRSLRAPRGPVATEGSAFNFRTLAAVAALLPEETLLEGNASMLKRPVREHLRFVSDLGGAVRDLSDGRRLRVGVRGGPAPGGRTVVDTRHSSQVLSSVLMVAPLAARPVRIDCSGPPVGPGYVDLTVRMMREQGAAVREQGLSYLVEPSVYQSRIHLVASDFTALSYVAGVVAAAPEGELDVVDYQPSTLSSERDFWAALRALGLRLEHDPVTRVLRIGRGVPPGPVVEIDGRNIPTVVPTLAAIAPFVPARVSVRNAAHVNNHKCRRIEVMVRELRAMGCHIEVTTDRDGQVDGFRTPGPSRPAGGVTVSSHGDHRICLSLATAAVGARRPTVVEGVQHLHASFPDFPHVLAGLGVHVAPAA